MPALLVDIMHEMDAGDPAGRPCEMVAMTLSQPLSPGAVVDKFLLWPPLPDKPSAIICGSCGRYAGDSLAQECARPHVCAFIEYRGQMLCRAGCK